MKTLHFPRLKATLLIILSVIITFTMISLPGTYVSASGEITYTDANLKYYLYPDSKTATLIDIDDSLTEVNVPSTVTKDGVTYTVNEYWSKKNSGVRANHIIMSRA